MSKIKVGTILEAALYQRVKSRAAAEGRTISKIIEDAVRQYTSGQSVSTSEALAQYEASKREIASWGLTREDIEQVMDEDPNDA